MIRKLRKHTSKFAKALLGNLCVRILQRKNMAHELTKFTGKVTQDTLDSWLDKVKEDTEEARGNTKHSFDSKNRSK